MQKNQVKNEIEVKDIGQKAITNLLNQVKSFAELDNTKLTTKETQYAVSIITNINKKVVSEKRNWNTLDITGCQLPAQIKRFSRLNLAIENQEIFIDIRNNSKTGLQDINLKMQYQGLEKLMLNYCSKKIVRYYKDVICKGDKIKEKPNLETGVFEIKEHEYFETDDIDYRNKIENIIGAYAIAYVQEDNKLVPYCARIDKNRIERGRKAATTQNIWNADTRKMTIKTAVWELYALMKPFMVMPQDLLQEFEKATENDVDFNKDYINVSAEEVKDVINENINNSEELSSSFDDDDFDDDSTGEVKEDNNDDVMKKYLKDNLYDND